MFVFTVMLCVVCFTRQQVIDELTREKSDMEERVIDTEQKLSEVEETAQKFLHLQVLHGILVLVVQSIVSLTLKAPIMTAADNSLEYFFIRFF